MYLAYMSIWRHARKITFSAKVQMQPPQENMKNIKRKKSVKMKSNNYNLLISIHSNPQLIILRSCDKSFVNALLEIAC